MTAPVAVGYLWLIALGGAATGMFSAWRYFRRATALADTATARIRSAPQGYVELKGRAAMMGGDPVLAPLSGLCCVWYRYRVEEKSTGGKWRTLDKGISDALFWIEDETGRCVVDPDGAEFVKSSRDVWFGGTGPRLLAGMEHGLPQWIGSLRGVGRNLRYTEQRILPGEEVHVLGLFSTAGSAVRPMNTRREVAHLLESWKRDSRRMALFDRNGDGQIDSGEWAAARTAARKQIAREQQAWTTEPDVHVLRNPNDWQRPYLISAVSERRLVNRYLGRAGLSLLLAVAAVAYALWSAGHP